MVEKMPKNPDIKEAFTSAGVWTNYLTIILRISVSEIYEGQSYYGDKLEINVSNLQKFYGVKRLRK